MIKKYLSSIFSIFLFIFSALLAIYSIWAFIYSHSYISEAISSGQLTFSGNEFDVVSFYMSNCVHYIIFAILLFYFGWLFHKSSMIFKHPPTQLPFVQQEKYEDDDLDEWFEEIQSDKHRQE